MDTTSSNYEPMSFLKRLFKAEKELNRLPSFSERQESEGAFDPVERGISLVPLDMIVGSVGRYRDFDSQFKPTSNSLDMNERLVAIIGKMKEGRSMPPISLYQIKDDYFILDGHHRVTAARKLGHTEISANVIELLPSTDTLENRLYMERTNFRDKAGLPKTIELTEFGQFDRLDWQIREHQSYLSAELDQDITYQRAATDWYRTIYMPLLKIIESNRMVLPFKGRTNDDLYLYISYHQWEQGKKRKYGLGIDKLIPKDMEEFREKMAGHEEQDYPEMRREVTAFVLLNVEGKYEQRIFDKLLELNEVREAHSVHGSIDIIIKIVLSRDLLSSDGELLTQFLTQIRLWKGIQSTQTLIPGMAVIKDPDNPSGGSSGRSTATGSAPYFSGANL